MLRIDQFAQRGKSGDCQSGTFHNLHPTTAILVQHPLWDQNLHSTWKRHLYFVRSEGGTLPHLTYRKAVMRVMSIVDRSGVQNMGSV